jgi:hypothetical protein
MTQTSSARPRWIRISRRFGCVLLLVGWFLFLLLPCAVLYLAMQGSIDLKYSNIPDDELRIWVISATTTRGLGISNVQRSLTSDGLICLSTNASFYIWQGKASPASHFCECYTQTGDQYALTLTGDAACQKTDQK